MALLDLTQAIGDLRAERQQRNVAIGQGRRQRQRIIGQGDIVGRAGGEAEEEQQRGPFGGQRVQRQRIAADLREGQGRQAVARLRHIGRVEPIDKLAAHGCIGLQLCRRPVARPIRLQRGETILERFNEKCGHHDLLELRP